MKRKNTLLLGLLCSLMVCMSITAMQKDTSDQDVSWTRLLLAIDSARDREDLFGAYLKTEELDKVADAELQLLSWNRLRDYLIYCKKSQKPVCGDLNGIEQKIDAKIAELGKRRTDAASASVSSSAKAAAAVCRSDEQAGQSIKRVKRPRSEFFKDVMEVSEPQFRADKNKSRFICLADGPATNHFLQFASGKRFCVGYFEQLSLGYLRQQAEVKLKQEGAKKGTFSIIEAGDDYLQLSGESRRKLDVGAQQADPANKGALFAVASNFNALETIRADIPVEKKLLEEYPNDPTQGPFASISAAPGLIYRNYFLFANKADDAASWCQTQARQINFLDELNVDVKNGYIIEKLSSLTTKITDDQAAKFKIGFHNNIQVTHGFVMQPDEHESFYDPSQVINQAFAAALALDYMSTGDFSCPIYAHENKDVEQIAKKILAWTYEAILKAAYIKGIKKVFLPRIGLGVFNNKVSWNDDAIAPMIDFIEKSGMDVVLNNFNLAFHPKTKNYYEESRKKMLSFVDKTGGSYVRYHKGDQIEIISSAQKSAPVVCSETHSPISVSSAAAAAIAPAVIDAKPVAQTSKIALTEEALCRAQLACFESDLKFLDLNSAFSILMSIENSISSEDVLNRWVEWLNAFEGLSQCERRPYEQKSQAVQKCIKELSGLEYRLAESAFVEAPQFVSCPTEDKAATMKVQMICIDKFYNNLSQGAYANAWEIARGLKEKVEKTKECQLLGHLLEKMHENRVKILSVPSEAIEKARDIAINASVRINELGGKAPQIEWLF